MWPRSAKKRVKAALSPLASIGPSLPAPKTGPLGPGQAEDIPTMGLFSVMAPVDP